MTATPGSRLKVIGPSGGARRKLCLRDCGELNGLAFDLNAPSSADVEIVGTGAPVDVGWVLPGGDSGKVKCGGTASPLCATYVVPTGVTFDNSMLDDVWQEGFTPFTVSNLVFDAGATYRLTPLDGVLSPLVLPGSLTLPAAMTFAASARLPVGLDQPVVQTAGGIEGDCVWTPGKGVSARTTSLKVSDDGMSLLMDKIARGLLLLVR